MQKTKWHKKLSCFYYTDMDNKHAVRVSGVSAFLSISRRGVA